MSTLFPSLRLLRALSALLPRLRLRDNVVRFRRRVSPTSLTPPRRSPARPLSDISPALHFPCPALPASPCLLYCRVVPVPTLFRGRVTLSTSSTSDNPPFPDPPPLFSPCRGHLPSPHFYRCSPTALPAGFIREAKCARDSYSLRKRASERERERKRGKGTLFLEGRNENYAGPTSASAHLLARKGCNGRRRWTKKPGGKKR